VCVRFKRRWDWPGAVDYTPKSRISCDGKSVRTGECGAGVRTIVIGGVLVFFHIFSSSKRDIKHFFPCHSVVACLLFIFFHTIRDCRRDFMTVCSIFVYRPALYTCNRHATVSYIYAQKVLFSSLHRPGYIVYVGRGLTYWPAQRRKRLPLPPTPFYGLAATSLPLWVSIFTLCWVK